MAYYHRAFHRPHRSQRQILHQPYYENHGDGLTPLPYLYDDNYSKLEQYLGEQNGVEMATRAHVDATREHEKVKEKLGEAKKKFEESEAKVKEAAEKLQKAKKLEYIKVHGYW
ncbi:hypothetical protein ST47_g7320 [Ascochyta rabiei]|uniref:Uncharacterized protein n=1 Tax=Didymella rabiei TaxID=5454 RepID=A0A163B4A8_DIDRA|nr:hypothetical protein ST47_g7320 [Ascochyta rabiei]